MSRTPRIYYETVDWAGASLVPVQYVSDGLITLRTKKEARKLYRAGTVGIISVAEWHEIQAVKGSGYNLDPAFKR